MVVEKIEQEEEGHKCHKCGHINTHNQDDFGFCTKCLTCL